MTCRSGYTRRLRRFRSGAQSFKVDWALAGPIPWDAPEARQAGTVHVGGTVADLERSIARGRDGILPERPFILLGQQSLADPTRAPEASTPRGDTAMFLPEWIGRVHRWGKWNGWRRRSNGSHRDSVTACLPAMSPRPENFERQNANLVGGDVGGGSYALDQLIFRPLPSLSPYRTPVRGLYLASASTFPGAAVHGVAGDAAARAVLTDRRLRRV